VVHTLIPNIDLFTAHLTYIRDICLAVEAVVFETETFLVIAKSGSPLDCDLDDLDEKEKAGGIAELDRQRFEKMSDIIKGFRKTCMYVYNHNQLADGNRRSGDTFMGFESKFEDCTVVLEPLSKNTFLLVVSADPRVGTSSALPGCQSHLLMVILYEQRQHYCNTTYNSVKGILLSLASQDQSWSESAGTSYGHILSIIV
jgi:hypothetical protein